MMLCLSLALAATTLPALFIETAAAGDGNSKLAWKPKRAVTTTSSTSETNAPKATAPKPLAPQTLNVDPQAKPISAAEPTSRTIDPFSDPFGDFETADEPAPVKRGSATSLDKSNAEPAGGTKKDLPWRDPGVIQVSATLPVDSKPIESKPEKKIELKSTALSWIRPKTPGDSTTKSISNRAPRLLDVDQANVEKLKDVILPVLNQVPAEPSNQDTVESKLAQAPGGPLNPCPKEDDRPKPIKQIWSDIRPYKKDDQHRRTNELDLGQVPGECPMGNEVFQPRNWSCTNYTWKASGLCHKPLYFEQPKVERYGHTFGGPLLSPIIQPALSTVHFYGSFLIIPYKMGMDLPWECQYPLGYYRPGDCAPYSIGPVPLSARGALVEAGVTVGLIFLIP